MTDEEAEIIDVKQKNNVFMRGAMNFEDYNYSTINEHVLVNQKKGFIKMTDSQLESRSGSYVEEEESQTPIDIKRNRQYKGNDRDKI